MEKFIEILKIGGPILGGFLAVGGIGAWFTYKGNKGKNSAEEQKMKAEVVVTFADGWQKYAEKLEKRMDFLEKLIEDKDIAHAKVVKEKDKRIDSLELRVEELETELAKYKKIEGRVQTAKEGLHHDVESKMNILQGESEQK